MRSLLPSSALAAAGLAGVSLASATVPTGFVELAGVKHEVPTQEHTLNEHVSKFKASSQPRRKTMGFGSHLPHARFTQPAVEFQAMSKDIDPFTVAAEFIQQLYGDKLSSGHFGTWVRPDSYTDSATGITHVYVGQSFRGYTVTNAYMNLNVKDGRVISYGSSFYDGPEAIESALLQTPPSPHREFCAGLGKELLHAPKQSAGFTVQTADQVVFDEVADNQDLSGAYQLYADNCLDGASLYPLWFKSDMQNMRYDPTMAMRQALAVFMLAAAPDVSLRDMIASNLDEFVSRMEVTHVPHFAPSAGAVHGESLIANVAGSVNPVKANLGFHQVATESGEVTLVFAYKFEVEMQDNWYETYVSVNAPHHILAVTDWASDASAPIPPPKAPEEPPVATYNVFKWGINDPAEGERTIELQNDDVIASPAGWHSLPFANDPSFKGLAKPKEFLRNTTTTWGNNVFAQENWEGASNYLDNGRPDAGAKMGFNYTYDPKKTEKPDAEEEANSYINATVSQLFYTCNLIHDMFYRYGFTEAAGNFQQYNFGRGGREDDAVIANAQDGSGYNNANFMTPPDGSNGRMRMYLWNTAVPYRDGDFEAGIVIHEYAHGISTRLTGGPANSACLGWGESGGMGEGWGDFFATSIRANKNYSDYAMGAWAANTPKGIRNYVYSNDTNINPSTYKTLDKPGYWGVHAIGEVWAEILWVVQQRLIEKHGFSNTLYPPQGHENGTVPEGDFYKTVDGQLVPKHGNSLSVQLVVNGMKLQPCQPSFFDARDAIIQADKELTGGENTCLLWKGFSDRGLGPDARVDGRTPWGGGIRTDDYKLPTECSSKKVAA